LVTREVGVEGGALVLENLRQPHSFTEDDVTFLEHVADHITLSVENVHLRETLRITQALDETNRFKGELISTLAHEMRTPLTSIKGYATALLMEEAAFSPETQREFLKFIDEECDTLQDLIHDLLESTIIDAGLMRLEFQPVLVARLTKDVIHDMALSGEKHRFLIDFPKDFPIVEADPDRITQVLRNLLDNAVKYSPQGGLIIVRGEVARNEITVSVADQGIGIAPDDLNRLFDKFFRANSRAGRRVVGSGLGLPIVRAIVESHGGRVWAESHVDQGTTLYFTLPIRNSEQDSVQIAGDAHE
jgi:signal transduction histidine kinase